MPCFDEAVRWLDRYEDMNSATSAGLGKSDKIGVLQDRAQLVSGACSIGKIGTRLRIKINAQLIDLLGVGFGHRPRVIAQGTEIGHPGDGRQLGRADLVGGSSGRKGDR